MTITQALSLDVARESVVRISAKQFDEFVGNTANMCKNVVKYNTHNRHRDHGRHEIN